MAGAHELAPPAQLRDHPLGRESPRVLAVIFAPIAALALFDEHARRRSSR